MSTIKTKLGKPNIAIDAMPERHKAIFGRAVTIALFVKPCLSFCTPLSGAAFKGKA